ncbi:substrate-binding domain-containing protein [Gephyromycinifex aptenodytis]|uniref:substrate-binding domain-containing protein n=1 Tax=Gephyromycinifex aptenodytis TaxID=2716227 RepID=UPI001447C094|nr:sugar-binding protein [Gephyromycinifex aptenodytis]
MQTKPLFAAFMAILISLALSGCVSQRPTQTAATIDPSNATVGVSMPTKSLERWNRDGAHLSEKLTGMGYKTTVQYADNKTDVQISQLQNMITQNVDVLVIAPIDGTVLGPVIAQAKAKHIPVLAYDRLIENTDGLSYYVSFDNFHVGELQGEYIVENLGLDKGKGPFNIEIFGGSPDDPNAAQFFAGAWSKLQPYVAAGKLVSPSGKVPASPTDWKKIGILGWDSSKAQSEMQTRLNSFYIGSTKLDVVLSPNDSLALGIEQAIGARGFKPGSNWPLITGQDADKANTLNILAGKQAMTVWKDTRLLGDRAALMVDQLVKGQTVEITPGKEYDNGKVKVPTFLLTPTVVTADNVRSTVVEGGFYSAAELGLK